MPNILGAEGKGAKFAGYLTFLAWAEFWFPWYSGNARSEYFHYSWRLVAGFLAKVATYPTSFFCFFGGGSCSFRPLATARKKKALRACVSHFVAIGVVVTEGLWLPLSDTSVKIPC